MKPQRLNIQSEALEEFMSNMNTALEMAAHEMAKRKLTKGTVTGKVEIIMLEQTNKETGEIFYRMCLRPDVKMKIGANAKLDCLEKGGIIMQPDKDGRPVIASEQISMEELGEKET